MGLTFSHPCAQRPYTASKVPAAQTLLDVRPPLFECVVDFAWRIAMRYVLVALGDFHRRQRPTITPNERHIGTGCAKPVLMDMTRMRANKLIVGVHHQQLCRPRGTNNLSGPEYLRPIIQSVHNLSGTIRRQAARRWGHIRQLQGSVVQVQGRVRFWHRQLKAGSAVEYLLNGSCGRVGLCPRVRERCGLFGG